MEQILLTLQLDSASLLSQKCLPRLPWPPVWSPKMFKCLQRKLKIIAICSCSCKSFKAATIRNTPFVHYCNFLQILLIHRVFTRGFCDFWWNCPIFWNYHPFLNTAVLKICFSNVIFPEFCCISLKSFWSKKTTVIASSQSTEKCSKPKEYCEST